MTYDAVAELVYPIIRLYDRADYEPTLIATMEQSTVGSMDSRVVVGTESQIYWDREPAWDGGDANFPAFMAIDVTELEDDIGLSGFWLYVGTGTNTSTVSSFKLEQYSNGYDPGNPTRTFVSSDVSKTAPNYIYLTFEDVHANITTPSNDTWFSGDVALDGKSSSSIGRVLFEDDFEGPWNMSWTNVDANGSNGEDTWGNATYRKNGGERSLWCAGSDNGIVYQEDFNDGGWPVNWTTYSEGPSYYSWFVTRSSSYAGTGTYDYVMVADSDRGVGTDITEWLYMDDPIDASAFENLKLRFYVEYDYYGLDEYASVLYATKSTYPSFTYIDTYYSDTYGYKEYDISSLDGESELYLAFIYHGTNDWWMVVDDVTVVGDKTAYDHGMSANLYLTANITKYDNVTLEYYDAGVPLLAGMREQLGLLQLDVLVR